MERLAPLDALLPRVLPQVSTCPKSMAIDAIQLAGLDFCKGTGVWQGIVSAPVYAGDNIIEGFDLPSDALISSVLNVFLDGAEVNRAEYIPSARGITLREIPQRDALCVLSASLRPVRTAAKLPEDILEEWGDIIAYGAIARLKSMAGQHIGWTDPQGAALNNNLYAEGCVAAKTRALRNRHGGGAVYVN